MRVNYQLVVGGAIRGVVGMVQVGGRSDVNAVATDGGAVVLLVVVDVTSRYLPNL